VLFSLNRKRLKDFSEQKIIALAISSEEGGHRQRPIDLHTERFGPMIPLIRRDGKISRGILPSGRHPHHRCLNPQAAW
jgi:hypothetical protein